MVVGVQINTGVQFHFRLLLQVKFNARTSNCTACLGSRLDDYQVLRFDNESLTSLLIRE